MGSYNFLTNIYIDFGNTKINQIIFTGDVMSSFIKKLLFPICLCICLLILSLTATDNFAKPSSEDVYLLKSYKNTVALYNKKEIVAVYDSIVLNTLPEKDILNFNKGIKVSGPEQAESFIEDFDG